MELWAKVTGNGANYAWTEQVAGATAGSWSNGTFSGTTSVRPAEEINGNATVPVNTKVRLRRVGTRWVFQYGACP